ncbi:MAG: putative D,D-dipeptide transport system permease protein DdpC [Candidatus Erwinia impunctatus]|nr:putative D,D-dipeptide transport system permease protein DdpC [Culicoides impunctatus]
MRSQVSEINKAQQWLSPQRIMKYRGLLVPGLGLTILFMAMFFPAWFTHYSPDELDFTAILQPPNAHHWFGTDQLGRDVYSRVIYGTSLSLSIGLGATLIACLGGILFGNAAVLAPGFIRAPLVRILDILLAFPDLLLALLVIAVMGRGPENTLLAVGIASIAGYARLVRSQVLLVKSSGFVEHAVALGSPYGRIIFRHIVPNTLRPLIILATIGVGHAVLAASALSFLGLGVTPPTAEWGALLADGRNYLDSAPWISLMPATVIALSVITITLFGRRVQRLIARGDI